MKTCLIIPVYNHEKAIVKVVASLKAFNLPCFLVNDGCSIQCSQVLADCADKESDWITLLTRPENGGKGAAVLTGFNAAIAAGFTHAIQIDADGQHDISSIPNLITASKKDPEALILGQPEFDTSAPKSRVYGRKITNFWICINTLTTNIGDGMCGLRLYPLSPVNRLMTKTDISYGMEFDIEILVRLYWQDVPVINIPTKVDYPLDGVSHFKMWDDNLKISKMHAVLFFGMLVRIPVLLLRKLG